MENENVIEWITNDKTVTVTLSQRKYITKVRKLAEKFPDEVEFLYENKDGSVLVKLPLRAIKINLTEKRELTEEQLEAMRERMRKMHESGQEIDEDDIIPSIPFCFYNGFCFPRGFLFASLAT